MDAISDPGLVLKITPPKLRKSLLVRERLRRLGASRDDVAVILVEAPAGYGKTSLLAHWRLDWLQDGAVVAWLNLDAGDSPITLVSGIALGLRRSMARSNFGIDAIEAVRRGARTATALTSLLAEITEASRPMAIVFDNCERIDDAEAVDVLDYLLHNLPPNLRVAIGTRPPARTETLDLLGQGILRRVTAADLSFDLPEAIHLLSARLGGRVNADLCARLQDITGGWPLGLQLAAAALERAADPGHAIDEFSKSHDDATQHLFESLVASLPTGLGDFLTRCALLDSLHPSLCEAVTGDEDAALSLQRLVVETPLLSATEEGDWLRLHPLAREYLRSRAEKTLPAAERSDIHVRAWQWLAAHGYPEPAAQHALAAGLRAKRRILFRLHCVTNSTGATTARSMEWLDRIPREAVESNPELRLVALWMYALGHHLSEALQQAAALVDDPVVPDGVRIEARIALAAAFDLLDRHDEARHRSLLSKPSLTGRGRHVLTHIEADFASNAGHTVVARRMLSRPEIGGVAPIIQIWRDFLMVWGYLWEGRPVLAEQFARVQHSRWEAQVGRRGPWTALLGGVLASACWQQDLRGDAKSATRRPAGRHRAGIGLRRPDPCVPHAGADGRVRGRRSACHRLSGSTGRNWRKPRHGSARCNEPRRTHPTAHHPARPAQAVGLSADWPTVVERSAMSDLLAPQVRLDLEMAEAFAAMASNDLVGAGDSLDRALDFATELNRGYEAIQILAVQALWPSVPASPQSRCSSRRFPREIRRPGPCVRGYAAGGGRSGAAT